MSTFFKYTLLAIFVPIALLMGFVALSIAHDRYNMTPEDRETERILDEHHKREAEKASNDRVQVKMCEMAIKPRLRNPSSYEFINGWVDDKGKAYVTYRAQNGFGGMSVETQTCN